MVDVLTLCTGNAARSVMAGVAIATRRPDLVVSTGGTFVVDGQPMSWRTRLAIESVGLPLPRHASRQVHAPDLAEARLVLALAPEHVDWIRREHPSAAPRTVTLKRLARDIDESFDSLDAQVAALGPAGIELGDWEEVADPGGGEAPVFEAAAREIDALVASLTPRLGR